MTPSPAGAPVVATATTPAVTPAAAAAPVPAGPTAAEFAALKAENDANKAAIGEHQRTAQFWHDKATKGAPAPVKKEETAEPEVDLLDLITTGGPKALIAHLRKQGLVTGEEVQSRVEAKVAQVAKETELLSAYPDLRNQDSEFFKATAAHYGELKKAGVPEALAMELGAQRAELDGFKSGKLKTPQQKTDEQKATQAAERAARAAAGGGDHGNRTATEEPDEELDPMQRQIAIRMLGGNGVTDDQAVDKYKARAKAGVKVNKK